MSEEKIKYIEPLNEEKCVAIRVRSCILFCYPISKAVLEHGPKVLTHSGKVVKRVQYADGKNGEEVVTGLLDDERLFWDKNGWFKGEEENELSLVIPERYFQKDWKNYIKLSNGDWTLKFGRPHPTVKAPE